MFSLSSNLYQPIQNIGFVLCIHFKIHSFRFYFLDLIMILFFFFIEFVKFNLYHEMDEMLYAYTYCTFLDPLKHNWINLVN